MRYDPEGTRANLSRLLAERGLGPYELASGAGIAQNSIGNFLHGVSKSLSYENLVKLERYLGIPISQIVVLREDQGQAKLGRLERPGRAKAQMQDDDEVVTLLRQISRQLGAQQDLLVRLAVKAGVVTDDAGPSAIPAAEPAPAPPEPDPPPRRGRRREH